MKPSKKSIIEGICNFDPDITRKYFYGYCRTAYTIYDHRYGLYNKTGLDFYSLAHEYYIQLLTSEFKQIKSCPQGQKLSTWMVGGFRFVVLDALKAYNKDFDSVVESDSETILEYVRSSDMEEGMLLQISEAVASHYKDRTMQEIAHMIFYAGYKQKDVAEQLHITPAAVNQRYKKMMEEVVTPYVIENYGRGIYRGVPPAMSAKMSCAPSHHSPRRYGLLDFCDSFALPSSRFSEPIQEENMQNNRITPELITSLRPNEIFVFGSNLQGFHGGGAARAARLHFGAIMGQGVGLQGHSYAIPTMQGGVETIKPYVDEFITFAKEHPDLTFLVTPIGCGIAGFEPEDIAPLFAAAQNIDNIHLPETFWDEL